MKRHRWVFKYPMFILLGREPTQSLPLRERWREAPEEVSLGGAA